MRLSAVSGRRPSHLLPHCAGAVSWRRGVARPSDTPSLVLMRCRQRQNCWWWPRPRCYGQRPRSGRPAASPWPSPKRQPTCSKTDGSNWFGGLVVHATTNHPRTTLQRDLLSHQIGRDGQPESRPAAIGRLDSTSLCSVRDSVVCADVPVQWYPPRSNTQPAEYTSGDIHGRICRGSAAARTVLYLAASPSGRYSLVRPR